ncbi:MULTISPECIES: alpha/beta hydrolase family protein [Thalassotalea]|uniref:alpha/beta hydrolase family protein n=1 Tax=Thalassotalea TaxID=1518149 RepID=UPI0009454D66|nr:MULTISPECIES: alpha/beta fold hydrolase [Thalassotalea]OKY26408.1 acetylesterase [Thalassotalea sp. PP2-459]
MKTKKIFNIVLVITVILLISGVSWYTVFGLKAYKVNVQELEELYSYQKQAVNVNLTALEKGQFNITFNSFDGERVYGQLTYPENADPSQPIPILIGVHGMGRTYVRWVEGEFKGSDTLEQTDELASMALARGYAVLAIDSRNHGKRKNLDYNIKDVMYDLWFWGKKEPYENMIIDSVKDHRVLLDWVVNQPQFDSNNISVAGYSMGGQISLILASLDKRVNKVLSIVPPASKDTVARVSPLNFVTRLSTAKVWLVTADNDEYASVEDNAILFDALNVPNKHHIEIAGEHILPEGYYKELKGWY